MSKKSRNKRYELRRLIGKGICQDCGGACHKESVRCRSCHCSIQGRRLGRLTQEKLYQ